MIISPSEGGNNKTEFVTLNIILNTQKAPPSCGMILHHVTHQDYMMSGNPDVMIYSADTPKRTLRKEYLEEC